MDRFSRANPGHFWRAPKQLGYGRIVEPGWEPLDAGGLQQALHLEHMTLLRIKMVRDYGHSANLVWARLKR